MEHFHDVLPMKRAPLKRTNRRQHSGVSGVNRESELSLLRISIIFYAFQPHD
jgi:hypothetical protein